MSKSRTACDHVWAVCMLCPLIGWLLACCAVLSWMNDQYTMHWLANVVLMNDDSMTYRPCAGMTRCRQGAGRACLRHSLVHGSWYIYIYIYIYITYYWYTAWCLQRGGGDEAACSRASELLTLSVEVGPYTYYIHTGAQSSLANILQLLYVDLCIEGAWHSQLVCL